MTPLLVKKRIAEFLKDEAIKGQIKIKPDYLRVYLPNNLSNERFKYVENFVWSFGAKYHNQEAEKLKNLLNASLTEVAKTQVIIEFLDAEKIKKLNADTKKKRILPLIGLGFGVVLLGLIFYKLHKQNG
jgi:hypothetical protein